MDRIRLLKSPDGKVTDLQPLRAVENGWHALLLIATNHDDGMVRIAAAERMIRLGTELMPDVTFDVLQAIEKAKRDELMSSVLRTGSDEAVS